MPRIVPTIATSQQAYDYLNITAAQAAANLPNGTTTLASWITDLLNRNARLITAWLDYDYTASQQFYLTTFGNNKNFIRVSPPLASITTFSSWDTTSQPPTVVNEGPGVLTILAMDQKTIVRNDSKIFFPWIEYYINAVQIVDPQEYAGWPIEIINIQLEMVAVNIRESNNGASSIGKGQFETNSGGRALNYLNMIPIWQARLRPWRRLSI